MKKSKLYRKLIKDPEILVSPGAYDCMSAKLIEKMGFVAIATSGAGISNSFLGKPDVGLLTLSENITVTRNIVRSVNIPVTADADTGYGNALNAYHAVQLFEETGVVGVNLEDQVFPKRCGHLKGKEIIPLEEMVKKIEAALAARKDDDFMIVARTDAASLQGIDEAIRRAKIYLAAGADMIFPDAVLSEEDIKKFVGELQAPVSINMGLAIRQRRTTPLISFSELEKMGVARVTFPRMTNAAALKGMQAALSIVKESIASSRLIERPELVVGFEEITGLMGFNEYVELEQKFLPEDVIKTKYGDSKK
jgi:2-methylisocitrate lyase-like PEP mutase family enzyme